MNFSKMTWGVKASFRSYVEAAGGKATTSDDVARTGDGAFVFEAVPGGDLEIAPDGTASGSIQFKGKVTFEAHGGMLKSTLAELALESTEDGLMLTVLDAPVNKDRCAIARLSQIEVGPDGAVTASTEITMDGMYQIADNYPPGTELDPLHLA